MKGFLVRQLDADGYGMVNAMMEALGDLGGNRLRVYEQAKEVVSEGCPSDGLVDCPYSCALSPTARRQRTTSKSKFC